MRASARIVSAVLAIMAAVVAGCGFHPIYGSGGQGQAHQALADVSIAPVSDRVGQLFYNRLIDRMNAGGRPQNPRFVLATSLEETTERIGFQKNEFATRANLRLRAVYTLQSVATGTTLVSNTNTVVASYNILNSDFATLAAESEARRRAARELADEVTTRLGLYFASNPDIAAGTASP